MSKNEYLIALGNQIRALRESRGLSQEEFAYQTNLSRSYYGGIERGERNIAVINLLRIAKALNVQIGELFPKH